MQKPALAKFDSDTACMVYSVLYVVSLFTITLHFRRIKSYSPHSWTILEGENPRILQKIRSPVFQCSRVHDVGRTLVLVVFPNKSEAFKLTMNAGYMCRNVRIPLPLGLKRKF
jgi:hypothetical protein